MSAMILQSTKKSCVSEHFYCSVAHLKEFFACMWKRKRGLGVGVVHPLSILSLAEVE